MRLLVGSMVVLGGCLPPATLQATEDSVAASQPERQAESKGCRVLLGELDPQGRLATRELRWDARRVHPVRERSREGLIVGDEEKLYELTLLRHEIDPTYIYGEASMYCEEDVIMRRKLPGGVAEPLVASPRSACVGEYRGERVELEASLQIVSILGPYLGWREHVEGASPDPTARLSYRTVDVRDGNLLRGAVWLLEPTASMRSTFENIGVDCQRDDAPQSLDAVYGFAIRWSDPEGPQLLVGYSCCDERSCELVEPLPAVDSELAMRLPDPDRLLHSPYGCGSIGLDGQLRTREGTAVGRVELDASRLLGVLFLPADHPFELDW